MKRKNDRLREIRSNLNKLAMIETAIKAKKASLLSEWEDIAGPVTAEAMRKFKLNMNIQTEEEEHEQRETIGAVGAD